MTARRQHFRPQPFSLLSRELASLCITYLYARRALSPFRQNGPARLRTAFCRKRTRTKWRRATGPTGQIDVPNNATRNIEEIRRLQDCIHDLMVVQVALQGVRQCLERQRPAQESRPLPPAAAPSVPADPERDELALELRAMTELHNLSTKLLATTELHPLLKEILQATIALQNADFGNIQLYNPKIQALEMVAHHGFRKDFLHHFATVTDAASACGRALKLRQRVIIEDVSKDPVYQPHRAIALSAGYRAVQATPLFSRNGEILGMISTHFRQPHRPLDRELRLTDLYARQAAEIIERKRTEEALRKLQSELVHVTRVTTMGELAASIAHEINQPLGAIVNNGNSCLRLLDAIPGAPREIRHSLSDIVNDANRASAIVARVRAMTRRTPSENVSLNLPAVIADVLILARRELDEHRIEVRLALDRQLPCVSGDRVQLQQVFLNLIVNSIEAMSTVADDRRILSIAGEPGDLDGRPAVIVTVNDLGIGLPPEAESRLFEAFYTTKPQGLGMGLRISRSIVEAHGGWLRAKSVSGPGTTFSCILPVAPPQKHE